MGCSPWGPKGSNTTELATATTCVCVCVCVCIFWILYHYSLLHGIEYGFLCYTVNLIVYFICSGVYLLIPYS